MRLSLLDGLVKIAHYEHQFYASVTCLMFNFRRSIERIGSHNHTTSLQNPKIHQYELWRVGHENSHPITFLDAEIGDCCSNSICQIVHFLIRDLCTFEYSTGSIWIFPS